MNIHEKIKELTDLSDAEIIDAMKKMTLQQYVSVFSAAENNDNDVMRDIFSTLMNENIQTTGTIKSVGSSTTPTTNPAANMTADPPNIKKTDDKNKGKDDKPTR